MVGGPHPTCVPEATLTPDVDVLVLGEGEETLVELLSGRPWEEVPGLAYRENQEVKVSRRPPPEDLDHMRLPAWHLVDLGRYRHPWRRPTGFLVTSRGCPYRCLNCTKAVHGTRKLHWPGVMKSSQVVVGEATAGLPVVQLLQHEVPSPFFPL